MFFESLSSCHPTFLDSLLLVLKNNPTMSSLNHLNLLSRKIWRKAEKFNDFPEKLRIDAEKLNFRGNFSGIENWHFSLKASIYGHCSHFPNFPKNAIFKTHYVRGQTLFYKKGQRCIVRWHRTICTEIQSHHYGWIEPPSRKVSHSYKFIL